MLLSYKVLSQTAETDNATAIANAISMYHRSLQPETGLYNGVEYIDYAYTIEEGSPFFISAQFLTGSVVYNNMLYEDVPLLYDIIRGEVVISDPSHLHKISLLNERITRFTVSDNSFVRLTKDSSSQPIIATGFYQLLYSGRTRLYKKQTRTIQESMSGSSAGLKRYVEESNNYYLEKNHIFYAVNNKALLLAALKDKQKAVQHFIKKNKLRFTKDKGATLVKAIAFYEE